MPTNNDKRQKHLRERRAFISVLESMHRTLGETLEGAKKELDDDPDTDKALLASVFEKYDRQQRFAVDNAIYQHGYSENPLSQLLLDTFKQINEKNKK